MELRKGYQTSRDISDNWIEIKFGPFGESPVYYWCTEVSEEDEKELLELLEHWFGPPDSQLSERKEVQS